MTDKPYCIEPFTKLVIISGVEPLNLSPPVHKIMITVLPTHELNPYTPPLLNKYHRIF